MIELGPLEAWKPARLELDAARAAAIAATKEVAVGATETPGVYELQPTSRIGVLVGDDWILRIEPRLAIPKLMFLLAYAEDPRGWKDEIVRYEQFEDVVSALAAGFAVHAGRAVEQGLLRGYVGVEERRHDLRGRVRFADQLARSFAQPLPLEVAYDDFTVDIHENRLLRSAAEILLVLPRVPELVRTRLRRLRALLEDVDVVRGTRRVELPTITRLNERYEQALVLAVLVLRAASISQRVGAVAATSFVFDLNAVFESFVYTALREALALRGGRVVRHHRDHLDEARRGIPLVPDVTWWRGSRCAGIVDAKYKTLVDSSMPNADAYQMLAYCIGLGVRRGMLVYAKESLRGPATHVIRRHGYEVAVRALDVEQEPEDVLAQVRRLAAELAAEPATMGA